MMSFYIAVLFVWSSVSHVLTDWTEVDMSTVCCESLTSSKF